MARRRYYRRTTKSEGMVFLALLAITFGLYVIYQFLGLVDLFIANATVFHWIVLALVVYLLFFLLGRYYSKKESLSFIFRYSSSNLTCWRSFCILEM